MPAKIRTNILLRMVHAGQRSSDPQVVAAADSLRSLVALNLKQEVIHVGPEMAPYYNVLRNLQTNRGK